MAERERLLLMARKLYRFITPLGVLAIGLGLWLWFGYGFTGGWLHAKTALVIGLAAYHVWCGMLLAEFADGSSVKSTSGSASSTKCRCWRCRRLHPGRGQAVLSALNRYFATCPRGLEALLAEDLAAGGKDVAAVPGGASCNGNLETGYRINLESRIATRVLLQVARGAIATKPKSTVWPTMSTGRGCFRWIARSASMSPRSVRR
jgi:hypothetical protein